MTSFVAKMFNKKTFESDFTLVSQDAKKIHMPDGIRLVTSSKLNELYFGVF